MRSFLFVFLCLFAVGCGGKDSVLHVKIKEVSWPQEVKHSSTYYKTKVVFDDTRTLTFDGIHDFKVDKTYKITVKTSDASLVKFEAGTPEKIERSEPQVTFKPKANTDKTVFKVVVDKNGDVIQSEEIVETLVSAEKSADKKK